MTNTSNTPAVRMPSRRVRSKPNNILLLKITRGATGSFITYNSFYYDVTNIEPKKMDKTVRDICELAGIKYVDER